MTDIDLLEDVAPASNELGAIANLAEMMKIVEDEINLHESLLKQKKQELKKLAEQDLPELMQELNIKNFTMSNGAKVEIKDVISASVPSQGAIDRAKDDAKQELEILQQQCFDWLRDNGLGSIIKNSVEVQFGRDEDDTCSDFTKDLQERQIYYKRALGVHPATLTSVIKERLSEGKEVPHDLFRVFTGRRANIRR
jgi:hypothetical protein